MNQGFATTAQPCRQQEGARGPAVYALFLIDPKGSNIHLF